MEMVRRSLEATQVQAEKQEQRWKTMQHQFHLLQQEVHNRVPGRQSSRPQATTAPSASGGQDPLLDEDGTSEEVLSQGEPESSPRPSRLGQYAHRELKLQKLTDGDDIEHYLTTFERLATACQWPRVDWAIRLVPVLTGKARDAFVHMDLTDSLEYDHVKAAILSKYSINTETYRLRFRAQEVGSEETPKELYVRLRDLYMKWINPKEKSKEEVGESIILEQYLRMLSPELQVWIKEHDPKSASEAAALADVFVAARRKAQPWTYAKWKSAKNSATTPTGVSRNPSARDNGNRQYSAVKPASKIPICYLCGQEGHTKPMCPRNTSKLAQMCSVPGSGLSVSSSIPEVVVHVNGVEARALVDTGSVQTLVEAHLAPTNLWDFNHTITVCCIHGDEKHYPTAEVYLDVQGQCYMLRVGLIDHLPYPVVLGRDLPILFDLLTPSQSCNVALTRAQSKQREVEVPTLSSLPFYNAELEGEPGKPRKSRSQRRREKLQGTAVTPLGEAREDMPLGFKIPGDIGQQQQADPTLTSLYQRAMEREQSGSQDSKDKRGDGYLMKEGRLYRQHGSDEQLVAPTEARELIMTLGHSIPWAGHLGKHKTVARISRHFYWPGLQRDVANFCKTCPQCQQTSARGPPRVPLQPLPIVGVPFERLGMDIVGPLERSKSGNRYMLVISDYATRYPEVFPLKNIRARSVAFSLVQLFSRVGFPQEILTDQGSNFMSTLLKQVYQLLGIKPLRTTPYHPQTDGLVERLNQTLKQMLRRFVDETGSNWDQWLPYLLFAYREVPQASTGFSPFELLYGRDVRGPLALLRESWEGNQVNTESTDIVSYVVDMRDKLEKMSALAQEHMAEAQHRQKTWYDRNARHRTFQPGQKVLVMLPSESSKLLAKWQGPFEITKQLGPTSYEVATPGQARTRWVLHVNLLKEWFPRTEKAADVLLIRKVEDEEEIEEQYLPHWKPTTLELDHLSAVQQSQIRDLCSPEVFKETPGHTTIVEHDIVLNNDAQAKRMSYRIPERLLGPLKDELDGMLKMGIIEPSKSDWCSPVVLVPKKDGTLRFCVDFRYLNQVSKFDSYPTPRIDELVERLGKAKYLTTLDLCKGYWQVPLSSRSRELTAFRTPWGFYQFVVLPFGLHGAPPTFQRLMDRVLEGLGEFASAYLDDIVIHSSTWEDHLGHLKVVFQHLQEAGLTVNPAKCAFARAETEYLGYVIGNGVLRPQVHKVRAVEACPLPQTKAQLRSFLGLAGWYRRFIPHFSQRTAVLTDLTRKTQLVKVQWSEDARAAFEDIRVALSGEPVLYSPDFDQRFILQTDASDRGIGAVLLQGSEPADRHPVAYISRKLFPREVRYSTVEKECLAVKWAVDTFRYYLLGREFTLEMDHRALQWMYRMRDTNARITRWYLSMQPFKFEVHHVPGRDNVTADFLSRCPSWSPEGGECVVVA